MGSSIQQRKWTLILVFLSRSRSGWVECSSSPRYQSWKCNVVHPLLENSRNLAERQLFSFSLSLESGLSRWRNAWWYDEVEDLIMYWFWSQVYGSLHANSTIWSKYQNKFLSLDPGLFHPRGLQAGRNCSIYQNCSASKIVKSFTFFFL